MDRIYFVSFRGDLSNRIHILWTIYCFHPLFSWWLEKISCFRRSCYLINFYFPWSLLRGEYHDRYLYSFFDVSGNERSFFLQYIDLGDTKAQTLTTQRLNSKRLNCCLISSDESPSNESGVIWNMTLKKRTRSQSNRERYK